MVHCQCTMVHRQCTMVLFLMGCYACSAGETFLLYVLLILKHSVHNYQIILKRETSNMSSGFSGNSEAFASEIFFYMYCMMMSLRSSSLQLHNSLLSGNKRTDPLQTGDCCEKCLTYLQKTCLHLYYMHSAIFSRIKSSTTR